jgi:hypothetical protein
MKKDSENKIYTSMEQFMKEYMPQALEEDKLIMEFLASNPFWRNRILEIVRNQKELDEFRGDANDS